MAEESSLDKLLAETGVKTEVPEQVIEIPKHTILLVDDEKAMSESLIDSLPEYNIITAIDGREAIKLYKEHQDIISCIVMDAKMPEMDGFEASRRIKEINPLIPIIMLTAYQNEHDISYVVDHNFKAYVNKGAVEITTKGETILHMLDDLVGPLQAACEEYTPIMRETPFAPAPYLTPDKFYLAKLDPSRIIGIPTEVIEYPLLINGQQVRTDQAWFHLDTDFSLQYRRESEQIARLNESRIPLEEKLELLKEKGWYQAIHSYWHLAGPKEIKMAAEAAGKAFEKLRQVPTEKRIDFLVNLGKRISDDRERWETISRQDFHDARTFAYELDYVLSILDKSHLELKAKQLQDSVTTDGIKSTIIYREPIGAVAVNTPPNTGFTMGTNAFADLFLAGIPAVYKPSISAAATTNELLYFFNAMLAEHNMPPGIVSMICGDSEEVVGRLMYNDNIKGLIHIGGAEGGRTIQQEYSDGDKHIVLELNGSDIVAFLDDLTETEFTTSAKRAFEERVHGAAGQFCVGPKRYLVPEKYSDLAIKIAKEVISKAKPGLMSDKDTSLIPTANPAELLKHIADYSKYDSVKIIQTAHRVNWEGKEDSEGEFVTPSIILVSGPENNDIFLQQELFGPAIQIGIVNNIDKIPLILDKSYYNLRCSFHTRDSSRIKDLADNCRSGGIAFNIAHLYPYLGYVGGGRGFSSEIHTRGARNFAADFTKPVIPRIVTSDPSLIVQSPIEETARRETREIVSLVRKDTTNDINVGYQVPQRVRSYTSTQDLLIVPKALLFDRIIQIMKSDIKTSHGLKILEPGIGPAMFAEYFMNKSLLDHFQAIHLEGADISHGMLEYALKLLNDLYKEKGKGYRMTVELTSGINCANEFDPYYQSLISDEKRFDAIIASQFEHYCPNRHRSDLAQKYRKNRVTYSTKHEFRQLCKSLLEEGGIYFTIDDRLGENPEEHAAICKAWDTFVVTQATNPEVLNQIFQQAPSLAEKLGKKYDKSFGQDESLRIASETRVHRRNLCNEEIEPLSTTINDLEGIFGKGNVKYMMHPSKKTHPGFYLAWAVKS